MSEEVDKKGAKKGLDAENQTASMESETTVATDQPSADSVEKVVDSKTSKKPVKKPGGDSGKKSGGGKLLVALVLLGMIFAAWYYSRDMLDEARTAIDQAKSTLETNQQQIAELASSLGQLQRNQQNLENTLTNLIQDQQAQMARVEARIDQSRGYSSERWQVAEARYLVRLADQRVRIGGDIATAIALLEQANAMLRDTGQARYTDARAALIDDLSRLRAAGDVDTQGLYMQISAVARRLAEQPLRSTPGFEFGAVAEPQAQEQAGWWKRALAEVKSALAQVMLVRKADETSQWMLDNASESAIRAQVGLLSTQALSALLSSEQDLYVQSLAAVQSLVLQHYEATAGRALLLEEIDALAQASLNRTSLDLDRSLQAMDDALTMAEAAGD